LISRLSTLKKLCTFRIANDSTRVIAAETPARENVGSPARGFVFWCFNYSYKITAPIFDIMDAPFGTRRGKRVVLLRILSSPRRTSEGSSITRCRSDASGIRALAEARCTFDALPLGRSFLDTLPYNAHTTASDALWAGLPLLTCAGESFPGRVAASLLNAIGLADLATESLKEYEAL